MDVLVNILYLSGLISKRSYAFWEDVLWFFLDWWKHFELIKSLVLILTSFPVTLSLKNWKSLQQYSIYHFLHKLILIVKNISGSLEVILMILYLFLGRNVFMYSGQWMCSNLIRFEHFVPTTRILYRKPWDSEFTEINHTVARTMCVSLWDWANFVAIWASCSETPERWPEFSSFQDEKRICKMILSALLETESAAKN